MKGFGLRLVVVGLLLLQGKKVCAQKSWNPMELWARKHESYKRNLPMSPTFTPQQIASQRAAGQGLMTAIQDACAAGSAAYTIPPGNYRFDGLHPTILANLHPASGRFRVIARGVTFWFERPPADAASSTYGLELRNCINVTIKGLSIDFDPVSWTQGKIVHIDTVTHQLTVDIDPGYPMAMPQNGTVIQFFHPNGRYIPRFPTGLFIAQHAEVTNPLLRQVAITMDKGDLTDDLSPLNHSVWKYHDFFHTGDCVVLPYRTAWALNVSNCSRVHVEHVGIYDSPGMGILEDGGAGHNVYDHVRIVRRPGTNRLYACCADGIHSRLTEHGPTIENCEISCNGDDIINLHGYFALVVRQEAPNRLVVASYAGQRIQPGQSLSLYKFHQASLIARTTVVSVTTDNVNADNVAARSLADRLHIILPAGPLRTVTTNSSVACRPGTLMNTHTNQAADFIIKNCYFHDSSGRCLLLNGACNGVVTRNIWRNVEYGTCLHMESWYYLEGAFCHDITIEDNRWDDCDMGLTPQWSGVRGLIYAGMVPAGNYLRYSLPLYNITITGNHINGCGGAAICMSNANEVQITGNVIAHPYAAHRLMNAWQPVNDYYQDTLRDAIYLAECSNVIANTNRVLAPSESIAAPVVQTGRGNRNVVVNGESRSYQQTISRDLYSLAPANSDDELAAQGEKVKLKHVNRKQGYPWLVSPHADGTVTFSSISATTVYLVCSSQPGANSVQALASNKIGVQSRRWLLTKCSTGKYRLSPVYDAALALQVSNTASGPVVSLLPWIGTPAQQWTLAKSNLEGRETASH